MLSEALRLVRNFHGIRQSELAKALNISKSYMSEIESGKKKPTLELLEKYSLHFDIPVSSLLLFSEKIKDESLVEKIRIKSARGILKFLQWVAEDSGDSDACNEEVRP